MLGNEDRQLVKEARTGSRAAASELFRRHWSDVWRVAYSVLGNRLAADDAAQEAMISAFAGLATFDNRRPLGPWLKRIAFNRAIDEVRRQRPHTGPKLFDAEPWTEAPELVASGPVAAAVARLAVERRTIVVLHYWLDCTRSEIAEILDVPSGTVASRLARALAELRSRLEEEHVQ